MTNESQPAVIVHGVSKSFKIPLDKASGIKQAVIRSYKRKKGYRDFKVLEDISFEIKKGEFFGIAGRNGSGKSTLLKLIAGIYIPNKGLIQINGSLTPFIELGVGFNPELTAHENVYLNGALLGFSRDEVAEMYDEIVEFAELGDFMAEKLKNFSSGMQVRLAFSIAIRARSEVLIMDEVLAVGDADFQKKCFNVFRQLKKEGRTIILVTHDMGNVERFCDRVLILDKGEMLTITSPDKAASIYARLNISDNEESVTTGEDTRVGTGDVRIQDGVFQNHTKKTNIFNMYDDLTFIMKLRKKPGFDDDQFACGLAIFNEDGVNVMGPNTELLDVSHKTKEIQFTIPSIRLTPGQYTITTVLYNKETLEYYDLIEKWTNFSVISDHVAHGIVELESKWILR